MRRWIPALLLIAVFIPCSEGLPLPTLNGVLFDQFSHLTARPGLGGYWHQIWPLIYTLVSLPRIPA